MPAITLPACPSWCSQPPGHPYLDDEDQPAETGERIHLLELGDVEVSVEETLLTAAGPLHASDPLVRVYVAGEVAVEVRDAVAARSLAGELVETARLLNEVADRLESAT